jgi:hypothetical protein
MSAPAKTSAAVATTDAPALRYVSSSMPMPLAGVVFDDDSVAVRHQLAHAARHEAYAVFEDLDLFRDADSHGMSRMVSGRGRTHTGDGPAKCRCAAFGSQRCTIED